MALLGEMRYGVNTVGSDHLRVHVGQYHDDVREPWLPRKAVDTREDLMKKSIHRSGTATPCLSTLLLSETVQSFGHKFGSKAPPRVLHYKGWTVCPSPEAAVRSFLSISDCILKAAARGVPGHTPPVAGETSGGDSFSEVSTFDRLALPLDSGLSPSLLDRPTKSAVAECGGK